MSFCGTMHSFLLGTYPYMELLGYSALEIGHV